MNKLHPMTKHQRQELTRDLAELLKVGARANCEAALRDELGPANRTKLAGDMASVIHIACEVARACGFRIEAQIDAAGQSEIDYKRTAKGSGDNA